MCRVWGKEKVKDIATPLCPWVLNSGTSEGLLACSTCCVNEVISDMPCYWRSAAPLHLPTEPKDGTDWNGSKRVLFVFVFLQVFLSFFCLLISCYFSPWPLLALTSFDFEVLFSGLEYSW